MESFRSQSPAALVEQIRQGRNAATKFVAFLEVSAEDRQLRGRLIEAGLLEVLFSWFSKCLLSFDQALSSTDGGDLEDPALWVSCLLGVCAHVASDSHDELLRESRLVIAVKIGSLAECLLDPKRDFFQSRAYWLRAVTTLCVL